MIDGGIHRLNRVRDLSDFLLVGGVNGDDPHPLFDIRYYLAQRPDLAQAVKHNVNPLQHYLEHGAQEGLNPHPLFDTRFYMQQCEGLEDTALSPLLHFLTKGWRMQIDPHPLFSIAYYQVKHPEVLRLDVNPLLHCLCGGRAEQGDMSPWFDGEYYLRANADVSASGSTPLDHYLHFGIAENRAASPLAAHILATRPAYARPFGLLDLARAEHRPTSLGALQFLNAGQRQLAAEEVAGFRHTPLVSLLLHVEAADGDDWEATLSSVERQTYPYWQLCVVLDPDVSAATNGRLHRLAGEPGAKVAVARRGSAGGLAPALNTALDMAAGDFIGVVGAGDRLHLRALSTLVGCLQDGDGCDLVYGDEDTVTPKGQHVDPILKPDWSPEYLLAFDYLSRLGLYRTQLVRRLNGFSPQFDAGCIHDFSLRASQALTARSVRHAAGVVYHRLQRRQFDPRQEARRHGIHRALVAFTEQEGLQGQIARAPHPDFYRVTLHSVAEPLVSIVIPTANASFAGPAGREWVLTNCIRGITGSTAYRNVEIIVVHDGNLLAEQVAEFEAAGVVLIEYDQPVFNFSSKINIGARAGRGDYVLILNDDVQAKRPDWLNVMLGYAERPGVGVVGAKLFFPDGRLQHTGIIMQEGSPGHLYYRADGDDPGLFEMNNVARNYLAVTGACQLLRRTTFDAVGGYDEKLPLNFNDVDFCLRIIDRGLRVVFAAGAELYHFEGITKIVETGHRLTAAAETDLFQARWRSRYPADPFYHPELPPYMPLGWKAPEEIRRTPKQARMVDGMAAARGSGVNFLGPVNRSSGLGTASRGYVSALQEAGCATRIVNMDLIYGHQAVVEHRLPSTLQDFPISLVQANADATPATFLTYASELQRAAYRIGVWVWELPAARPDWFDMMAKYDEIWVPTQFCHDAFKPMTKRPVTIVPYALIGLPELSPSDSLAMRRQLGIPEDNFVFLFMFDAYSFVDRKNPSCLLDAFEAEFGGRDDVTLVLKISYFENLRSGYSRGNFEFLMRLERFLERCKNARIISEIMPQDDLYRLINASDCYVSPHRSEGFGLTVAEAMFYRKVVIATDFGGTRDLVSDVTGLKLDYRLVELADDMGPYLKGNVWADPRVSHLRELMQTVVGDAELRERLGNAAHSYVSQSFSSSNIGRRARNRLLEIAATL